MLESMLETFLKNVNYKKEAVWTKFADTVSDRKIYDVDYTALFNNMLQYMTG